MENSIYKTPDGQRQIMVLYDSFLAAWPVPCRTRTVSTRYGDTAMILCGDEALPPLILLHGASSNATAWAADAAAYSRHFFVIAVDVIGEPGRSAPTRPPWEGHAYAEWLADVLDGLNIKEASLLGLSQGGWIALKFAICYPQRVQKLVLLSPAGVAPTKPAFILRAMVCTLLGRRGTGWLNRYVFGGKPIEPLVEQFMDLILLYVQPRFDREYLFSDAELARLNMPVFLVGGTRDVIRSIEAMQTRLQPLLPGLQSAILPDTGHVLINTTALALPFLLE